MRAQLDRLERLERAMIGGDDPIDAIHIYLYAPSSSGPLLVGAIGPRVPGRDDISPIRVTREPAESEQDFIARVSRALAVKY